MSKDFFKNRAEKSSRKKATGYNLNQLITDIDTFYINSENKELYSNHDIGLMYCTSSLLLPKDSLLSSYQTLTRQNAQREIKKRNQEESRMFFYQCLQNLDVGNESMDEIRLYLEKKFIDNKDNYSGNSLVENSIEREIHKIMNKEGDNFDSIGKAVREGSKKYSQIKGVNNQATNRFKLFLEYNRILTSLKEI